MSAMSMALCTVALLASQQDPTLEKEFEVLSALPKVRIGEYRCAKWIEAMNHLRQLGKEKSLSILKGYFAKWKDHERIQLACRLLFVNPKGWDPPRFGAPGPAGINERAIKEFPLFPFAISEGVPFVVVSGYQGGGKIGGGKECLDVCESLQLIKVDYSTTGWEKAARVLTQSDTFLQLHTGSEPERMIKLILDQAKELKKGS